MPVTLMQSVPVEVSIPDDLAPYAAAIADLTARVSALESATPPEPAPSTSIAPFIWHKNTGSNAEKTLTLPIDKRVRVIYSVALPDIQTGDLIEAFAKFEITSEHNYAVAVGHQLFIASRPDGITGVELSEAAGENVTHEMHHIMVTDFGSYQAVQPLIGHHIVATAHIASDAAALTHTVAVEPDYGRLFVKVTRKAVMETP